LAPDAVEDWTPVVERARWAVLEAPEDAFALRALGAALYRAGQWREARDTLAQALKSNPGDAAVLHLLSQTLMRLGQYAAPPPQANARVPKQPSWADDLVLLLLQEKQLPIPELRR
jgi:uncharacterized protein HemY